MNLLELLLAVPLGLLAGGFVTMLVDRMPDATALSWRSRCPHCSHRLSLVDTIPLISWFARRGECRHCSARITAAYPLVEAVTAGLLVLAVWQVGVTWRLLPIAVLIVALVALSVIDLYVYRLPDRLMFPSIVLSLVAIVVASMAIGYPEAIWRSLAGGIGYFVFLLIAHLISPRGMGFGDVKLALLLGLHLGFTAGSRYEEWSTVSRLVFYALFMGCVLGVVVGLSVALVRRFAGRDLVPDPEAEGDQPAKLLQNSFPFGPALAAATLIAVLFSDAVLGV